MPVLVTRLLFEAFLPRNSYEYP